ncbi:MAG: protein kinase [Rhodospirillaceae bacterium]
MTDSESGSDTLPPGSQLNEYRIRAVLGRGGFGITYVAEDIYLDHVVAIKEYCPIGLSVRIGAAVSLVSGSDPEKQRIFSWGLQRFIDEARILARCRHPNIIRVIRYFEANGTAYLVMDFEPGEELGAYRKRLARPFTESELRGLMIPLMYGLATVHRAGFLHRDIKPGNIMVRSDGVPVLLDFGAARQAMGTRSGLFTVIVTNGYAPIEQYSSDGDQGPWTDVYGLGAVFYWAITGQKPPDSLSRMRNDPYQPVSALKRGLYSEKLLAAVDGALMFEPSLRFQSITEWREVLQGERPVPAELLARITIKSEPVSPPITITGAATAAERTEFEPDLPLAASPSPPARPGSLHVRQPEQPRDLGYHPTAQDQFAKKAMESWRKSLAPRSPQPAHPAVSTVSRSSAAIPAPAPVTTQGPVPPPGYEPSRPRPIHAVEPERLLNNPVEIKSGNVLRLRRGTIDIDIPIGAVDFMIGRSSKNNLVLTDPITSRIHARIICQNNQFLLSDVSKFGTWVQYSNGHTVHVMGKSEVLKGSGTLAFGAEPEFASDRVSFQCPDPAESDSLIQTVFDDT